MALAASGAGQKDITPAEGALVTAQAESWKGTPYKLIGPSSMINTGGDCSGSTWRIFVAAGFSYDYQATATFAAYAKTSGKFRELGAAEKRQEGDVLLWSDHMAIASDFDNDKADATTARVTAKGAKWTQTNDMWTATHTGGPAYGPGNSGFFKSTAPRVFRYQK